MRIAIGIFMCLLGIILGLYAGFWWAFVGGIMDIIGEIRAPELSAMNLAIGIVKVFFAGLIGWAASLLFLIPGAAMLQNDRNTL